MKSKILLRFLFLDFYSVTVLPSVDSFVITEEAEREFYADTDSDTPLDSDDSAYDESGIPRLVHQTGP